MRKWLWQIVVAVFGSVVASCVAEVADVGEEPEPAEPPAVAVAAEALTSDHGSAQTSWSRLSNATATEVLAQRAAGFRVVDLDVVSSEPRFDAVFVANTGSYLQSWDLVTQLTHAEVLARNWGTHTPDLVKPYLQSGVVRYAVVSVGLSPRPTWSLLENATLASANQQMTSSGRGIADIESMPSGVDRYAVLYTSATPLNTLLTHGDPDGILTWLDDHAGSRLVKWRRQSWGGFVAVAVSDGSIAQQWMYRALPTAKLDHLVHRYHARPLDISRNTDGSLDLLMIENGIPTSSAPNANLFAGRASYDNRILAYMKKHGIPAVGLALMRDGRLIYAKGYGSARVQEPGISREAATPSTLFRVGSISKGVSAAAYLKLIQSGARTPAGAPLSLDTRVFRDVLKDRLGAPLGAYVTALDNITAAQLMHHTAGFSAAVNGNPITDTARIAHDLRIRRTPTIKDTVRWMLDKPPGRLPDVQYEYFNTGPIIIAAVIEVITGDTYENFIRKRLFAPLGVESGILPSSDILANRAPNEAVHYPSANFHITGAHIVTPKLLELAPAWVNDSPDFQGLTVDDSYGGVPLANGNPTGGLAASPAAFAKLLTSIDGTGKNQVLSAGNFQRLQNGTDDLSGSALNRNYGLFTSVNPGNGDVFHGGTVAGGFGWYVLKPGDRTGWVVFANSSDFVSCPVTIYEGANYTGASRCLERGSYTAAQIGFSDNSISSLKVAQGLTVRLYDLDNFTGTSLARRQNDPNLADNGMDNRTTSLIIESHPNGEMNDLMIAAYNEARPHFLSASWDLFKDHGLATPLNADAGFESQASGAVSPPWNVFGLGGIDLGLGLERTGMNNAFTGGLVGWNAVYQAVPVVPFRSYRLTGYVRTAPTNNLGRFGARLPNGGLVVREIPFASLPQYTRLSVDFNAGLASSVEIYVGLFGNLGLPWAQFDDVVLQEL